MEANYFTILYCFCHTSTWIRQLCTRVPYPESPSHLPTHTIPLGHPSAPAPSILYHSSNLDWLFVSYIILYMFQCHSPKSTNPLQLRVQKTSIHQCLFFYQRENLLTEAWASSSSATHTHTLFPAIPYQNQMVKPRNEIWERTCMAFELLLLDMSSTKKKKKKRKGNCYWVGSQ